MKTVGLNQVEIPIADIAMAEIGALESTRSSHERTDKDDGDKCIKDNTKKVCAMAFNNIAI